MGGPRSGPRAFSLCAIPHNTPLVSSPVTMKKSPPLIDPTLILLTPSETARRLSISVEVMQRLIERGEFPTPRRIGRAVRFHVDDVKEYAATRPAITRLPRFGLRDYQNPGSFAERMKTHEWMKSWRQSATELAPTPLPRVPPAPVDESDRYVWRAERGPKNQLPLP